MSPGEHLLLLLAFLIGSGFYSGIETGIVSVNRVRLRHLLKQRERRAESLSGFIEHPDRMLATTLIGTNLCNTAFTVMGTRFLLGLIPSPTVANAVAAVLLLLLILVFGEYLPKAWFQSKPLERSLRLVPGLQLSAWVFRPVGVVISGLVRLLFPAPAGDTAARDRITRRDVQFLLSDESGATPDLGAQRRQMIDGVFSLAEKTARDIMVPRAEMKSIRSDISREDLLDLARRTRAKSFPVFSDREQRFTGILKLSDVFQILDAPDFSLPEVLRPPQYVTEDTPADDLIPRLRLSRQPMLLVRNDKDVVTGFVTTEVVLEEILGPLYE